MSPNTSRIRVGCKLVYQISHPSSFILNCCATKSAQQLLSDEVFSTKPFTPLTLIDFNGSRQHRLQPQCGQFVFEYSANVELKKVVAAADTLCEIPHVNLPPETLTYLNPSRYCECDLVQQFAADSFGGELRGYSRVKAISDWAFENLAYCPGTTDASTTANDVLNSRQGVCRDFAHVCIAICRALGIPARYVSGYAVDLQPPDFHGFFEAYLGDRWFLFDPTKLAEVNGLVRIATGRDAADTPFATIVGAAELQQKQVTAVTRDRDLAHVEADRMGTSTG